MAKAKAKPKSVAGGKGEPKQAPSPSVKAKAKTKAKAKPKSVAGGKGEPKQAPSPSVKAKANAKRKAPRAKKQSVRKRNEELLLPLFSDAVLVAFERTALGTATDADERENIIRVAETTAAAQRKVKNKQREEAEHHRDTMLAKAEAAMKKEVQRRREEDERRSAAEAEMRRAEEEEIRTRLAEDNRRGEAQAVEQKLAADEAHARAEAEAAARAADAESAEAAARIMANENLRRAAADADAARRAETEKAHRESEDMRRAAAHASALAAEEAEKKRRAEEARRRADLEGRYAEAFAWFSSSCAKFALRRANAAAALKAAWDAEKAARESAAAAEAAAEQEDKSVTEEDARLAAARKTLYDAVHAKNARRADAAPKLVRFDVDDRRLTESEERRRAQFNADLPRLSGRDVEAAWRDEVKTRAAEEARRREFDAFKRKMEDDERRAREAEETRVAKAIDNLINLERAVDNAASTTSTRRESWERRLSKREEARRAKADGAMRTRIWGEVVLRRDEDNTLSVAEINLRLQAAEAARLPAAEIAIRTCTEHTVAAETTVSKTEDAPRAAAQRDAGDTSTPTPVTPAPPLTTTPTTGTWAPTPGVPAPTPAQTLTPGAPTPAPTSASTPTTGTPAPTLEPVLDQHELKIRRLAKKLLDGPLKKLKMPGTQTRVEVHVVESILATCFARFESGFAEAIFESHEGGESPLVTLGGRLRLVGAAADRALEAFTMRTLGVYYFEAGIDKGEDIRFGVDYEYFRSLLQANKRTFAKYTGKVEAVTPFERALQHLGLLPAQSGTAVWQDLLGDLKKDLKNGKTERLALTLLMDYFDIVAVAKKLRINWKDTCTLSETVLMATVRSVFRDDFGGLGANIADGVSMGRTKTGSSGPHKTTVDLVKEVTDVLSKLKGTADEEKGITVAEIVQRCDDDVSRHRVRYVLEGDCGDGGAFFETSGLMKFRRWRLRRHGDVSAALGVKKKETGSSTPHKTTVDVVKEVTDVLSKLEGTADEEKGITVAEIVQRCDDDVSGEQVRVVLNGDCGIGGAFFETSGLMKDRRWRLRRHGDVSAALGVKKKVTDVLSKLKGTADEEKGITVAEIVQRCGGDVSRFRVRYVLEGDCGDGGAFFETRGSIRNIRWRLRRHGDVSAAPKKGTKRERSEDGRGDDLSAASGKQRRKK